jgi:hypothetical protein
VSQAPTWVMVGQVHARRMRRRGTGGQAMHDTHWGQAASLAAGPHAMGCLAAEST